ncbi:hypothetical protein RQP50_25860 [Paenibacillus sp. chi10]|uniref:Uncharacterized protein n=1 Tax=Paenibacillus suaedae TaxID=3077233 RepID=A0AAJ2N4N0_9BACL|nr:hypothetical protein [Paenibacillus sp. chi10]MDT8979663.1 hypothetical protein [Paenibacillus sp. chi10]
MNKLKRARRSRRQIGQQKLVSGTASTGSVRKAGKQVPQRKSQSRLQVVKQPDRRRTTKQFASTHSTHHRIQHPAYQDGYRVGYAKGYEDAHQLSYANQA